MSGADGRFEAAVAAYRAAEPRRRRSPFADPRLAQIAEARAARGLTPWYRRLLVLHPAPAFATSALALLLLVLPAHPAANVERSAAPLAGADMGVASPAPLTSVAAETSPSPDLLPALLAAAAVAGVLEGIRRVRAGG